MSFQKIYGDNSTTNHEHITQQKNPGEIRTPRIDVFESDSNYYLRMSLPGVRSNNLHVQFIKDELLEIKGHVAPEPPETINHLVTQEIFEGPFYRLIRFPVKVVTESIQFDYDGGIIEIYIDKSMDVGEE
ncbi:Hsp20/alpha crystallin family protein [Virgibacillus kekensis]|uniref:Hsp20/alpha crystallin family protein n=1 Tax=Virgibacillus kekensis TaxID=202261 RepID=A0ABV9DFX1_9BACI